MKKFVYLIALMLSLPAFAADDSLVMQGQRDVLRARQQLSAFLKNLPPFLRGYATDLDDVDDSLARAQGSLQLSLQQSSVVGYACSIQETRFNKIYVGHGQTKQDALADAMKQCDTDCSFSSWYKETGCSAIQN